jgi:hypothetical protein
MNPSRLKLETLNALGASFTTKNTFDISRGFLFLDSHQFIYPAGHHIAVRDIN